jgi:hypothetical protein
VEALAIDKDNKFMEISAEFLQDFIVSVLNV